jgi:hypothetical protein
MWQDSYLFGNDNKKPELRVRRSYGHNNFGGSGCVSLQLQIEKITYNRPAFVVTLCTLYFHFVGTKEEKIINVKFYFEIRNYAGSH